MTTPMTAVQGECIVCNVISTMTHGLALFRFKNVWPWFFNCVQISHNNSVIFQRRGPPRSNHTFFRRTWNEYQQGFEAYGELWLGLARLHSLTSSGTWRLDVTLGDFNGRTYKARYNHFTVGNATSNYKLGVHSFDKSHSQLGDQLNYHNGRMFSTYDKGHDTCSARNAYCSNRYGHAKVQRPICEEQRPHQRERAVHDVGRYTVQLHQMGQPPARPRGRRRAPRGAGQRRGERCPPPV